MIELDPTNPYGAIIDHYEDRVDALYRNYIRQVEQLAAEVREQVVVPMLKRRGWEFLQGNGTWSIVDASNKDIYEEDLPEPLRLALCIVVEGAYGNPELGLWMEDYTTKKTKNR